MDKHGNLYASTDQRTGDFHHSTFFAGGDVAAASELTVKDAEPSALQHVANRLTMSPSTRAAVRAKTMSLPPTGLLSVLLIVTNAATARCRPHVSLG
jgi:hypothetical protein